MSTSRTSRSGWTIADQALSSASNFVLAVLVARAASRSGFGGFSVGFSAYLIALGVSRGLSTQPLLIRLSGASRDIRRAGGRDAVGAVVVLGLLFGLALAAVAFLFETSVVRGPVLVFGISVPGLLVQDAWRFYFLTEGTPRRAAINDLLWTVLFLLLATQLTTRPVGLIAAWGAAGTLAAVVGPLQARAWPRVSGALGWVRSNRDLSPALVMEFFAIVGSGQLVMFGVSLVAGLQELGALRAAHVALGPMNVLFAGASLAIIPEFVRAGETDATSVKALASRVSLVLAALALVAGGAVLALPSSIGRALLGATWSAARPALVPVAATMSAAGAIIGSSAVLQALGEVNRSLRARLTLAPANLVLGMIGAITYGAVGTAIGMACGQWIGAIAYRVQLHKALASASVTAKP